MEIKPPKTFEEQIEILKSRGLIINDENFAITILKNINYYRFSAYLLPYKKTNGAYAEETYFVDILMQYMLDTRIRSLLLLLLENIEISFRSHIAYTLATKYGALSYLTADYFEDKEIHSSILGEINTQILKSRDKVFIKHHNNKYDSKIPIWVLVEILSFGTISRLYSNLKKEDKIHISQNLLTQNLPIKLVESFLHKLTFLRNSCAHYERIYNARFKPIQIMKKYKQYNVDSRTLFAYLLAIKELFYDKAIFNNTMVTLNKMRLKYVDETVDYKLLGFPENWLEILTNDEN